MTTKTRWVMFSLMIVRRPIIALLLSSVFVFGQSTATPNVGLKKAAPGSQNSGDAVNSNADKLDSILSGNTPIPGLVVKKFNGKVYADQFADASHRDLGSQINAAIAALPVIKGVPTGVVSLEGYQGAQTLGTTIQLNSHAVSIVGPGKSVLTVDCIISNGDCIRIKDDFWAMGTVNQGPYVTGITLVGHGQSGAVGMHIGDMYPLHLQDILIFGFSGADSIGILFENQKHFTEQLNMTDVRISNNRTGMRYTNNSGPQATSFGYGTYVNVFMQPGAGQTALVIDGTPNPILYHSNINWIFEDLRSDPGQANTYINLGENAAMIDNTYSIVIEDQGRNTGPWLRMGNNSAFTGSGHIQSWGRSVSLGSNVIFNVSGKVEIWGLNWSPVQGHVALDSGGRWGSGASVSNVSGQWPFFTFMITAGANPTSNPGIAITFPSANTIHTWRNPPIYMCKQVGGSAAATAISGENSANLDSMQLKVNGAPNAGSTYVITCQGAAR
jgi:hypothetical protein